MIAYLKGQVLAKNNNYLILGVNDVGYKLFATEAFLASLKVTAVQEFYISHQVREEASDLYAFKDLEELDMFELLLSVSGVGPKSALAVIALASPADIKEAVARDDASLLIKVSGIGKKTAERVVLELKGKIMKKLASQVSVFKDLPSTFSDELEALMSLGYALVEAREALQSLDSNLTDSGERVKAALKKLSKRLK
ncbi:MAG: Holliday junction branch migration protein RuvA [Patescibacteria group bacterium]|jgi:Holliday junction DNA helicase RuvA|nr:Holliday junction branch migration protein RuvA [Patescibacteria group bacterium]